MKLAHLLPLLSDDPALAAVMDEIATGRDATVSGVPAATRPALIAALAVRHGRPLLVVTPRSDRASELAELTRLYAPPGVVVDAWPAPDSIPYERLPRDPVRAAGRLALLSQWLPEGSAAGQARVLVTPTRGLLQHLMPPAQLAAASATLRAGEEVNVSALLARWVALGYEPVSVVEEVGAFSRRGGIVDIWPPTSEAPVRVEFWGDVVDSLRRFDPATQRSSGKLDLLTVTPPYEALLGDAEEGLAAIQAEADLSALRAEERDEWLASLARLAEGTPTADLDLLTPYLLRPPASLLDYLPPDAIVLLEEPGSLDLAARQLQAQAEELRAQFEREGELPAGLRPPYHAWDDLTRRMAGFTVARLGEALDEDGERARQISSFEAAPTLGGRTDRLVELVADRLAARRRTLLVTEQAQRLAELLADNEIYAVTRKVAPGGEGAIGGPPRPGTVEIEQADLGGGWQHGPSRLLVLSDLEIFGWQRQRRTRTRRSATAARAFLEQLKPGDFVVHIEHGIAEYQGLITREAGGVEREYMLLRYAGADRLFVPIDQTDRVLPYTGAGDARPALNRLGSPDWERTKRRVRKAVIDLAQELLRIYAARETAAGFAATPDTAWQREMEDAFPYEETPDQRRAIDEVKRDMETERPMDRLICGDVGYGKTEVAVRAAFKAINSGRQVAVLVPTTVLALQHFETFTRRLGAFPVRVEMLSRLRARRQQAETIKGLASGAVDLVIGTHRLLQRDVRFRDLGLVIVDEEQRFGVRHKERLKQLRVEVDVLTLSATPIPRTLHMGLVGVRDMSIIETPPGERLPIRTFVRPSSDDLMREVILREMDRGGQVFFVHNRVQSIYHIAHRLRDLVPEARFLIGHGQMDADELEQVMLDFVAHKADVLVCTTIIESGLDIPNVNTLIVDNAVHFGLAQLYQLRGRVGRSSSRAYAYFLYDPTRPMTAEAQERLETIQEATELGSGFRIAMKDLEIRGAGSLLGAEQHGHVEAVGFDLYARMLARAVEIARGNSVVPEMPAVKLDLPIDAHLPASYVEDPDLRLGLYQRLAQPAPPAQIAELERELIDRFGPLPAPARNLIWVLRVKSQAIDLGIESITMIENELVLRPVPTGRLKMSDFAPFGAREARLTPNTVRLDLNRLGDRWASALDRALAAIEDARASVAAVGD